MVWVLVAVILASIVYAISVLGEYRVFVLEIEPKIVGLLIKAEKYEEAAIEETEKRNQVRQRVRDLKDLISGINREVRVVEAKIRKAQEEEEQLELQAHKLDFELKR